MKRAKTLDSKPMIPTAALPPVPKEVLSPTAPVPPELENPNAPPSHYAVALTLSKKDGETFNIITILNQYLAKNEEAALEMATANAKEQAPDHDVFSHVVQFIAEVKVNPWATLSEDTSWTDGKSREFLVDGMVVEGMYSAGYWSEGGPSNGREYNGAVFSLLDDRLQFEIEEIGRDPANWGFGQVTHSRPLTDRPSTVVFGEPG